MDGSMVAQVRRFHRVVTQRAGALEDGFLARARPLGQARLLWEIGSDVAELRSLRLRLSLDSGYLNRLLRALEADGLVEVGISGTDARVHTARLTEAGLAERTELDRLSDEQAQGVLEPLGDGQREELVNAMATVERLLTASMVRVEVRDPSDPDARACVRAYVAELADRFDAGFDPDHSISAADHELRPPAGLLLVATLGPSPVACGSLKFSEDATAHVKRMWVSPAARGLGLGRRLLTELETHAAARGVDTLRLETNRALTEAIGLYRAAGYREVPAFNDEPYAHHWFEKTLAR